MKRYERLASQIGDLIRCGDLAPGTRIPAVRAACDAYGVSPSTVFRAYYLLESQGLIVARPRSGYFVSTAAPGAPLHGAASTPNEPSKSINISELVFEVLSSIKDTHTVAFGSAFMSPAVFPMQRLGRSCASVNRSTDLARMVAALPPGDDALRRQIALRYLMAGLVVHVDEIIITSGALDALTLSLQVLTRAGDEIAIEKPTFYAALQAIQRLQLKIVEIPVHPVEGHDMEALTRALDRRAIRACWFMTSFQNPTGATLSDTKKQALVELLAKYEVPLIEDDVYSELRFGLAPIRPAKFFDRQGLVLHCGSFAKCLAPGYRIGWAAGGRFTEQLERAKWMTTLSASAPAQRAIADYLEHGRYDRFLRKLRRELAAQQAHMLSAIDRYFPAQSTATRPDGGYFTWVELPRHVDSLRLFEASLERGISFAPGPIFSASGEFRHHIRLNYGYPWTQETERAMATLGALARDESLVSANLAGPMRPF
ncbi:PLP-dependent aminotransferase family protein [Caballeronia sordidicola]|uniref:Transcriptional regulator, GntR family protein / Aspartate aminotransferase n=1 Tax=Caballeronia sordidicola TaxID=196367 RepID=A0A242MIB7_CABSO|nr:PLP-dependent aminotransferase family protein [Caballeronia sordidicola]OTP71047.1 Transcriptional regulator, GntR family protein / Aspartate aminotransferase [Caballeronia sordidicola]